MPKINVNQTTLSYKEIGSGDKILISTQNFFFTDSHMELLGKPPYDYHVYLITMRGYGESEHIFDETPQDWISVWGQDVLAFADAIGAQKFYYSGVSHGCFAGWYIAFHQPERLLGFAATSGVAQFITPGQLPIPKRNLDFDKILGNREALSAMSWNTFYSTKDEKRLARRELLKKEHLELLVKRKKEEFLVHMDSMSGSDAKTEEEFYADMAKINFPVLIVNGIRDDLSTTEKAVKAASVIPGAKLITYEHFEHAGPDECPEIVARDCDRFFRDTAGRVL